MAYNSSLTSEQVEQKLLGILAKDNTEEYTPSGDYNPATKKYVDDNAGLKNYRILTESEYSALGESVLTDNILYFVAPDSAIKTPNITSVIATGGYTNQVTLQVYGENLDGATIYYGVASDDNGSIGTLSEAGTNANITNLSAGTYWGYAQVLYNGVKQDPVFTESSFVIRDAVPTPPGDSN